MTKNFHLTPDSCVLEVAMVFSRPAGTCVVWVQWFVTLRVMWTIHSSQTLTRGYMALGHSGSRSKSVLIIATLYGPSRGSGPIRAFRLWCVLVYVSGPCQPDDSFCLPVALRVIGQIQWNSNGKVEIYHSNSEVEIYHSSLDRNWNEGSKFEQQGWNHSSLDWNNYWSLSAAYDPQRCLCDRSAPRGNKSTARMAPDYQRSMIVGWPRLGQNGKSNLPL